MGFGARPSDIVGSAAVLGLGGVRQECLRWKHSVGYAKVRRMPETCKPPRDGQHCEHAGKERGRGLARDTARSHTLPVATSFARTAGIASTTSSANAKTFMVGPPEAIRARWKANRVAKAGVRLLKTTTSSGGWFLSIILRSKLDKKLDKKLDTKLDATAISFLSLPPPPSRRNTLILLILLMRSADVYKSTCLSGS